MVKYMYLPSPPLPDLAQLRFTTNIQFIAMLYL